MRIKVDHQLQRTSQMEYVIQEPKTESGVRYVPMTEKVAACFRRIIADREAPKVEPEVGNESKDLTVYYGSCRHQCNIEYLHPCEF